MLCCRRVFTAILMSAACLAAGFVPAGAGTILELQNPDETKKEQTRPVQPPVEMIEPGQTEPKYITPGQQGVIIAPTQPSAPQVIAPIVPQPQVPGVIAPVVPGVQTPSLKEGEQAPTIPTTPVPVVPTNPVVPTVIPPTIEPLAPITPEIKPEQKVQPEQKATPILPLTPTQDPDAKPGIVTPLTPGSFLITTPEKKTPEQKEPAPKEPTKTPPAPAQKPEPKKPETQKPDPKKPDPKKPEAPKKGDKLTIPEEAKQTGKVDFLEGCWVGTRPEYNTKRIITERFCFDKSGIGKRYIRDPGVAGECIGATKANMLPNGVLQMTSEKMYCTDVGDNWGASRMTCQGEGEQTPCTWVFDDLNQETQSYTIRFVRE